MATPPTRPAQPRPAEERHPAQPPPVRPGVATPDQQPRAEQAKGDEPEEKVLSKEEAMQLFRAGHKLRKKGDPDDKWLAASRVHGVLCICKPLDEQNEKTELEAELVLISD